MMETENETGKEVDGDKMEPAKMNGGLTEGDGTYHEEIWRCSRKNFDATLENFVSGILDIEDVMKRHHRVCRSVTKKDTIEHVTKIMESIEEELHDLKRSQQARDLREPETKTPTGAPRCLVLPKGGGVNCTKSVYHDPKEWRISRREVEQQIRDMRMQLETLKEIRRHLIVKKPQLINQNEAEGEETEEVETKGDSRDTVNSTINNTNKNKNHAVNSDHQKNHMSRHHDKKHEKMSPSTSMMPPTEYSSFVSDTSTTMASSTSLDFLTPGKFTISLTSFTTETLRPPRSRKNSRKQKSKDDNRPDLDNGKSTKRKKIPNYKKNMTVLTNSVHDEITGTNVTENITSYTTRVPSSLHRHHHYDANKITTLPISRNNNLQTFQQITTPAKEVFTKMNTEAFSPELTPVTSADGTNATPSTNVPAVSTTFPIPGIATNRKNFPMLTLTTRKPFRILKNRTSSPLGPARIDVTILEPPDGRHKQAITTTSNNGRLPPMLNSPLEARHKCYCEPDPAQMKKDEKEAAKEERRKLKEERLRKKERKMKKKAKFEEECFKPRMNCFVHDNDHWKTAPLWSEGPFCACVDSNNNTYSCLRTINSTHNFLYCEFATGTATFYNLRIDPFEQWNRISSLTVAEKSYLHNQLEHLKGCKGTRDCTVGIARDSNSQIQQHQRYATKKKYTNSFEDMFVPSALQIIRESELGSPSNKRRKKLPKRSKTWQSNIRHHEYTLNTRRHRHQYQYN